MDGTGAYEQCRLWVVWPMPDEALGWIVPEPEPGWLVAVRHELAGLLAGCVEETLAPAHVRCVADFPDGPAGPTFEVEFADETGWERTGADRHAALLIGAAADIVTSALPRALRHAKRAADALFRLDVDGPCEMPCCTDRPR